MIYPHPHEFSRHSARSLDFRLYRPALKHPSLSLSSLERPSTPRLCCLRVCFYPVRDRRSPLLLRTIDRVAFIVRGFLEALLPPPFSLSCATCHLSLPFTVKLSHIVVFRERKPSQKLLQARDSQDIFISAEFITGPCKWNIRCNIECETAWNARRGKTKRDMPDGDRVRVHSDFGHSEFYRIERVSAFRGYTHACVTRAQYEMTCSFPSANKWGNSAIVFP